MNGFMDTILDTRAELFSQLSYIVNDEDAMKKVLKYIKKVLTKKAEEEAPAMSKEEILADLEEACHYAKLARDKKMKGKPIEELLNEL